MEPSAFTLLQMRNSLTLLLATFSITKPPFSFQALQLLSIRTNRVPKTDASHRGLHIGWSSSLEQREHWVPYEQPVENDANGGFEQAIIQGSWRAGQRFVLVVSCRLPASLPCVQLDKQLIHSRSIASIPYIEPPMLGFEFKDVRFDDGKREQRVLCVKTTKNKRK
jgi:hypothetical protein